MLNNNNAAAPRDVIGSVMVVGGGIAGIQASLDLAESGYLVHLVESKPAIGGVMAQLDKTFPTNDCAMCIISPKLVEAGRHLNIDLHTLTDVEAVSGAAGNFEVRLKQRPRFIELEKCTSCGECAKVCPIDAPNAFDQGLGLRQAAYKLYPQGMPSAYAIDKRGIAPCKATCPAHVSIQGYIALMRKGQYREALDLFRQDHPFPGVCGRVCHHPCEQACSRNDVDQPLAIRELHRFLDDWEREQGDAVVEKVATTRSEKIAVIGSGPAGLTAAATLARQGYPVTIFEKLPVAGGMMAVGIPSYRLPRNVLADEINRIVALGVTLQTGVTFGSDITLESLQADGFKAVFVATGLHGGRKLGVANEDIAGVLQGVDFLRDAALGKEIEIGKEVLVIGGGNVAIDVALTAKRKGAAKVTLVCLEAREQMPAWEHEIQEALESDIEIVNSFGPKSFFIDKSNRVSGIEFKTCSAVFDADGRFNPQYDEQVCQPFFGDTVIVAIGQSADIETLRQQGLAITPRGGVQADPLTLQTSLDWVFAGGDVFYGPKSVVEAVACGKEAAESMRRYISGEDLAANREAHWACEKPDVSDVTRQNRTPVRCLEPSARECNFLEVSFGYNADEAAAEALRCLQCGICSECYQCVKACLAEAVNHDMTVQHQTVHVGAIILAPGFEAYNPVIQEYLNYKRHPNVVTSLEFERILSASGPHQGHLVRPSDHQEPKRIAWLQCVGSRSINRCDHAYCSSVCCMYAVKQTVVAKEHSAEPLDTVVFYMDLRTFGKDFDRYVLRAANERGVRLERARIHTIEPLDPDHLKLRYLTESGDIRDETFDMVVLSVGLAPVANAVELARTLGIELNTHQFARTSDVSPVATNREGVYVCGAFQGPKDIPQSVMEASAAAAVSTRLLASARSSLTRRKILPDELDFSEQEPRIGVFVCNCGINIGGVADVPAIRDYARSLPHVVHVEDNLFTCSQDTQDKMKETLLEKGINRVVVASCSPRTHEPLFQETLQEAGLNKYLFEMANIRDQNTWVHQKEPARATAKAKDLVRMAVAKAARVRPLHQVALPVQKALLVVGGGVAGLEAALGVARQNCQVVLVEKSAELGGNARYLAKTWQGESIPDYLAALIQQVTEHPQIEVLLNTEVARTTGALGNFSTELRTAGTAETRSVIHGAAVLATGGHEYKPTEYLYGQHSAVMTHLDFDQALTAADPRLENAQLAVFIQCVGSRTPEHPSCSRVCCTHSLKSALLLKERQPDMQVFILYRDVRAYGFRETIYSQARAAGIQFIRFDAEHPPELSADDSGNLCLRVKDHILNLPLEITPDLVVLASAVRPNPNRALFEAFKVPVNAEGFLVEAHAKLRPVDFASEGLFMAGLAHYPKSLDESIAQAQAAVSRVMTLLSKDDIMVGGVVAVVDESRCAVCLTCVRACPYHVPYIGDEGVAVFNPADCHGCGVCVAECPGKAITLQHFSDAEILAKTDALFEVA